MIESSLKIMVPLKKNRNILDTMEYVKKKAQLETGFISYRAYNDMNDQDSVCIIGKWETCEDLLRHIGSSGFRAILAIMDMSIKSPELRFRSISSLGGLELVSHVIGNKKEKYHRVLPACAQ